MSQRSLQGDVCAADLVSPLENGCSNASGVFQDSLSEDLEVLNLNSLSLSIKFMLS